MFNDPTPRTSSLMGNTEDRKVYKFHEMSKPFLEIWNGAETENADPFETVELDRNSRKYIHIRINNIKITFDQND